MIDWSIDWLINGIVVNVRQKLKNIYVVVTTKHHWSFTSHILAWTLNERWPLNAGKPGGSECELQCGLVYACDLCIHAGGWRWRQFVCTQFRSKRSCYFKTSFSTFGTVAILNVYVTYMSVWAAKLSKRCVILRNLNQVYSSLFCFLKFHFEMPLQAL